MLTLSWSFQKGRGTVEVHLKYKARIQTSLWRELPPVQTYVEKKLNSDQQVHVNLWVKCFMILDAYFCATNVGSKKSVVILRAYMEHAVMQQIPVQTTFINFQRKFGYSDWIPTRISGLTTENEVEARQNGQTSLGGVRAPYFCALHSQQCQSGTEETQANGSDHQTPTHLDIRCKLRIKRNFCLH